MRSVITMSHVRQAKCRLCSVGTHERCVDSSSVQRGTRPNPALRLGLTPALALVLSLALSRMGRRRWARTRVAWARTS